MNPDPPRNEPAIPAWAPLVPMALGLALLAASLAQPVPGFHHFCDSGLKEYNLWLWSRTGSISNELSMPEAPDWARAIWADGFFPIQAPFAFERKIVFPPFFQLATYPAWRALGYRGLFILPALSVIGMWAALWRHWAREGLGGLPALVGMSVLALSPLTFFGAMFWEHAPALFLFMAGFLAAIGSAGDSDEDEKRGIHRGRAFMGGASMALAVAMRPELVICAAVALAFAAAARRRRWAFAAGGASAAALCVAINLASTGAPLGIHHQQERFLFRGGQPWSNAAEYFARNAADFLTMTPVATASVVAAAALRRRIRGGGRERAALLLAFGLSFGLLILLLPNLGGFQLYPRYFLFLIPAGAMLAARLARHGPRIGWGLLALHALALPALAPLFLELRWSYRERVKPLHDAIEADPPGAVVVSINDAALDFIALSRGAPFFQASSERELAALIERLAPHVAPERIAFVFANHPRDPMRGKRTIELSDGRSYAVKKTGNGRSVYYLFRLVPR